MKTIALVKNGDSKNAFATIEADIPVPESDEVVIKVHSFGLNFADVVARRGLYPDAPPKPAVLGYDVAGFIHAVGSDVSHLNIGDRVTAMTRFGGYAEYAKTKASGVAVIGEEIDFAKATTLTTQACTAYYCAEDCVTMHKGERILIQAASGGVGSIIVQLAKHRGCEVFGTGSSSKLDYLAQIGVDHPIDYTKVDFHEVIKKSNYGGLDIAFDSLGGMSFKKARKLLKPGGKLVYYGAANQINGSKTTQLSGLKLAYGFGLFTPITLLMQSKAFIGVNMLRIADSRPDILAEVLQKVIEYTEQGIINPRVSKVFKAEEIAEAHDYLEGRKSMGKVVLEW